MRTSDKIRRLLCPCGGEFGEGRATCDNCGQRREWLVNGCERFVRASLGRPDHPRREARWLVGTGVAFSVAAFGYFVVGARDIGAIATSTAAGLFLIALAVRAAGRRR